MRKLLLALLIATPAYAQSPEMRMHLDRQGINANCYPVGFTTTVQTVCMGQAEWNVEVQQLFNTFGIEDNYVNSLGVSRTLRMDIRDGFGVGPWVQHHVLKEFRRRGVKL